VGAGLRVAFLGNAAWSVPSLEALVGSSHEVALVLTRVPRPAPRGTALVPTPVAEAARRLDVPLHEVETVRSGAGLNLLRESAPDVLVVVAYGEILPPEVLRIPNLAPLNVHFSLLPELRGPAPVQRAILEGMVATGVTTMVMDEGVDTGPVVLQAEEGIDPEDDSGSLGARLAALGGRLLVDSLDRLAAGTLEPRPQDDARATYAPKLTVEERVIDWTESASACVRRVRALTPEPSATTRFRGSPLKILSATEREGGGERGTVVHVSKDGFLVAAGNGSVAPIDVAPAGRKRMTAGEFVNGFRPRVGERLG
jgi:methionyl-tRNA formyltransferase